jgi:hypothetical protein
VNMLPWALEGADLEDVSSAEEDVRFAGALADELTPELLDRIIGRLSELAELASRLCRWRARS